MDDDGCSAGTGAVDAGRRARREAPDAVAAAGSGPLGSLRARWAGNWSPEHRAAGRALVLLHGNGGGAAEWDRVLGLLPPDQPVVCPEAPGHGGTPAAADVGAHPERPWSRLFPPKLRLQKTAQLVADGLARVGLTGPGAAVIVGFSDGANVALELAVHRPETVAGLLLIGANARPGGLRARTHAGVLLGYAALRAWGVVSRRARQRARVWGLMVGQPLLRAEQLGRIGVPTVVMAGGADMIAR
ncbi:MAG: alpha/beta fold hydrolase, partial [Bifidobacteriaceae bacterium]|nr:alpha/beta fold hydrolase [Bifidobacteriaceae bacterium]